MRGQWHPGWSLSVNSRSNAAAICCRSPILLIIRLCDTRLAPHGEEGNHAGFDWFSAAAVAVLMSLWRSDLLGDEQELTAMMVVIIAARFVWWFASRQMNKRTPAPAPAGA